MNRVVTRFEGAFKRLSNFSDDPVSYGLIDFPTAEHAFAAAKTTDLATRLRIAEAATPNEAKRIGRSVQLRPDWDQSFRYSAMLTILSSKFAESGPAAVLRYTNDAMLVEGNHWHDNVWGDCYCERPACKAPGMNLLGWMLMQVRSSIQ